MHCKLHCEMAWPLYLFTHIGAQNEQIATIRCKSPVSPFD